MNVQLKRAPMRRVIGVRLVQQVRPYRFQHMLACGHFAIRYYRRIHLLPCLECLAEAQVRSTPAR
jgi:hypothetical protein